MPLSSSALLSGTLSIAMDSIEEYEGSCPLVTQLPDLDEETDICTRPPYNGHGLFQLQKREELQTWGETVELLWQVSMTCAAKEEWNRLTYRILVWRSIVGPRRSQIGEWVRKETIACLHSQSDRPR